jgi:hypothetical protein
MGKEARKYNYCRRKLEAKGPRKERGKGIEGRRNEGRRGIEGRKERRKAIEGRKEQTNEGRALKEGKERKGKER